MSTLPNIEEQRRFWDWHWSHEQERRTRNAWKGRRYGVIMDYLGSLTLENPRILDVGCGSGWYTGGLSSFGPTTGIDLSPEAIQTARSRFPGVEFHAGNLYDIELPEGSFDVIVAQEVFDHVEDQPRFVQRACDLLADDGYLVVSCTNRFVYKRLAGESFPQQPTQHIERSLTMHEFKRALSACFDIVAARSILPMGHGGILRFVNSAKLNLALQKLVPARRVSRLKEQAGLGYQNVILAQKRRSH